MGINRKRILEVRVMSKILNIIALLLVIAAVVFVAGCANKTTSNVTQGASEQGTSQTPVSSEGVNQSEVTASVPANTSVTDNGVTNVNEAAGNVTESTPAPGTHISTAERNRRIILSRMNNSTGTNTSQ
jgi:hypothetical protein